MKMLSPILPLAQWDPCIMEFPLKYLGGGSGYSKTWWCLVGSLRLSNFPAVVQNWGVVAQLSGQNSKPFS